MIAIKIVHSLSQNHCQQDSQCAIVMIVQIARICNMKTRFNIIRLLLMSFFADMRNTA